MENRKVSTPLAAILLAVSVVFSLFHLRFMNFITVLTLLSSIALCVVLFMKRRDIVLLGVLAAAVFIRFITYFTAVNMLSFLSLLGWLAFLLFAMCVIEQTVIKVDLSKIAPVCRKFFFVPAAVLAFCTLASFIKNLTYLRFLTAVWNMIKNLLIPAAVFFLAQWLLDPYDKSATTAVVPAAQQSTQAAQPVSSDKAYCDMVKHILLCLFTCGIWYCIWTYRTTRFLNTAEGAEQHNPTHKLLLCMFVPFYQIYWFYKQGQRLDTYCNQKNLPFSEIATVCLLLGVFIPVVACIMMQDRINTICTVK